MPTSINSGDTAWMLVSTALVLLMTPGLAFFYAGMVRAKNAVSTMFQNYMAMCVVAIIWAVVGYSLVFSGDVGGFIGNLDWVLLNGIGIEPNADLAATIPHILFVMFQGTFAIITPALITGSFAERIRFKGWLPFMALWSILVYSPVAHWVWGPKGWIRELGGLDFAGGLVVHMTAGYSALVAALVLGKRQGFGEEPAKSYNVGLILLGTALLWFGWFGFNAGSSLGANGIAAQALATTLLAGASSMLSWTFFDWFKAGKPSATGAGIGAVAGLVAITPAAGFVSIGAALTIGMITGLACNYLVAVVKEKFGLDDTLDVFACHGAGGTIGTILTAVYASTSVNSAGTNGLLYGDSKLLVANSLGALAVVAYSMIMTFALIKGLQFVTSLRVSALEEEHGLDHSQHGERILSLS
ncbi:MAG: ammonium transporter [Oligoflexales bacterium]